MSHITAKYDTDKVYTDFMKVTFILRSGKEITVKYPTEEFDDMIQPVMEILKMSSGVGQLYIPEFNGINQKTTIISIAAIDVIQF